MSTNRIFHTHTFLKTAAAALVCSLLATESHATVVSISTADAGWRASTTVEVYDASPWPGATLPDASTFTVTPVHDGNRLHAYSGVMFFEESFSLPAFGSITGVLASLADNNMQIFINGVELAMYGTDLCGFCYGTFGLAIAADGTTTNGYNGLAFSQIAASLPTSTWVSGGTNLIQVAVRNLSGGDQGNLYLTLDLTTSGSPTAAPEPASLALLGLGLAALTTLRRRPRQA